MIKLSDRELRLIRLERATRLLYNDLIMQVASKLPGESRHDTAKRYIAERENRMNDNNTAQACDNPNPE